MPLPFRLTPPLRRTAVAVALALPPLLAGGGFSAPARAQESQTAVPLNEIRALNVARQAAVNLNGGLSVYRPANCMFTTSAASNPCLVRNDQNGFVYRFLGGPPGWEQLNIPPTLETELQISPDGRSVVQILHNGAPR